jgi:hypothetical protein
MRNAGLVFLPYLTLFSATAAVASDADVIKRFGMAGTLALNCSAPAGKDNPYMIYAAPANGKITRTLKMDPSIDGTFPLRNLRMVGPDSLQSDETGLQSEVTVTMTKIGGKFRSWRSNRADGTVLIADGKFANSGKPTPAFELCRR